MSETSARFGLRFRVDAGRLEFATDDDVRPTTSNPIVHERKGSRRIASMRSGLAPYWAKDLKAITTCISANSGTAVMKPMFRAAFKRIASP